MIAKLAYLTSPAPNRFVLNLQTIDTLGNPVQMTVEISKAHLANILVDGTALALREQYHRVPSTPTENANESHTIS